MHRVVTKRAVQSVKPNVKPRKHAKSGNERNYAIAVQALKEGKFVLEADQLVFKRGRSAFVSSTTNFVMMDGEHASVQIAANSALAGPNGIGGITVDGSRKEMKITTDKRET